MNSPCQLHRNIRNSLRLTCSKTDCTKGKKGKLKFRFDIFYYFNILTRLLFVEFESVFPPCMAVSSMLSLNAGESPLLLLLTIFSSSCILGAIILAKTYKQTSYRKLTMNYHYIGNVYKCIKNRSGYETKHNMNGCRDNMKLHN